ncbi:MAG: FHA domain-containing protein [Acidobacteriota bacterium]|nr:FHA domain-containing protein [Acidobacteriota bacterium]
MKIILAEQREGKQLREQKIDKEVIRIGRDANDCDIAFDNRTFSMVSRRHAELRRQGGQWILFDNKSSFGTFVNGEKTTQPQAVAVGDLLQFGLHGPILKVIWFETENNAPQTSAENSLQNQPIVPQVFQAAKNPVQDNFSKNVNASFEQNQINQNKPQTSVARLEFVSGHSASAPFKITKNISLGRDTSGDIVFEASAAMVSRRHAEIRRENGKFVLIDNGSFNGTLVNGQRIAAPTPLNDNDEIQIGRGGPVLRFSATSDSSPTSANFAGQRSVSAAQIANLQKLSEQTDPKTMAANVGNLAAKITPNDAAKPQLLMTLAFDDKKKLTVGRADGNDIKLDGLQISNRHARILQTATGVVVEDLNSTNGVYINGNRTTRGEITPSDAAQIGSFQIKTDGAGRIGVFDTRAKTRIDAINLAKEAKNRTGGGTIRLIDDVSISIQPNEFVGILGASGAGKSTLMNAVSGMRSATGGSVFINNLDLYKHLDSLKQSIGYVPQDDTIHRELTVERTLYYIAKLRLSRDVSRKEINRIIDEVLDITDLDERRNVPVSQLSGGQRKRVSIAVELITKPSVIFLDEPTSGLDPLTEEKIMRLFRQIAESGRTVVLTTHAMENVKLFDKIVVLMRGKLIFYGAPVEALTYFNAASFKELFDKLEEPNSRQSAEQTAEEWKRKFTAAPQYKQNIAEPLKEIGKIESRGGGRKSRLGIFGSIRQTATLARRYSQVLLRDKLNLFILFAQAPIIGVLTYFVMDAAAPRDFVYFVLALVSVWFGISVSAREIVRERAVFRRERMVNLGLIPYLFSKLVVLGMIVGAQCLLLFLPLKILDFAGLMPMPGEMFGIPQLWVMLLTAAVGVSLGLLVSALVKTSEMATSLVPLILIPQILFSGLVGVPSGINKTAGLIMPATWSFDAIKRFSTLDTLQPEGAEQNGETRGLGLYKYVETENEKIVADANKDLTDYKNNAEQKMKDYASEARNGEIANLPKLDAPPRIGEAKKIPKNLSGYVSFLHPWMNAVLNQLILMLMFSILVIVTLFVLRLRDNR